VPEVFTYGGFSGVTLETERFEFTDGVEFRRTYAHVFASPMVAFAPPGSGGFHPAPWKAAKGGGYAFDVHVELCVPASFTPAAGLDARFTIWWIAALLRLAQSPYLTVPLLSECSFSAAAHAGEESRLQPFEVQPRIFSASDKDAVSLTADTLEWVRSVWLSGAKLLADHSNLRSSLEVFDQATVRGRPSSSLLALWGGLEQLFAPSTAELRYRVSSLLAAYLEPHGEARLALYKRLLKLYNQRSQAAHTAAEPGTGAIVETFVLMRNVLVKIIDSGHVPTQDNLERLLFCPE
jgi:hypothetical protein